MKAFSVIDILLLGLVSTLYAAPTNETNYPEVIPGPGLPSLASLGITSAQLYEEKPALSCHSPNLSARQSFDCVPSNAQFLDVIACYQYLLKLGNTECVVPGHYSTSTFCTTNTARILGYDLSPVGSTSSPCSDVTAAVLKVIDNCRGGGKVTIGGYSFARGNEDLRVFVTDTNSS